MPNYKDLVSLFSTVKPFEVDGQKLFCKPISGKAFSRVQEATKSDNVKGSILFIIASLCDESGSMLLTDADADALCETLPFGVVDAMVKELSSVNGFGEKKSLPTTNV